MTTESEWIDISVPLRTGMVHWPGDPPVRIERVSDMEQGAEATLSQMQMSVHSGTHMDAPLHFLKAGKSIDSLPFAAVIGEARVIEADDPVAISAETLAKKRIQSGERILLKTRNSGQNWPDRPFMSDFVYLSTEAAQYLAESGVLSVGVDYLSIGGYGTNGREVHRNLLGSGIWIIEGLYLNAVPPDSYEMICLPLNIAGSEGAPARAVLRPLS